MLERLSEYTFLSNSILNYCLACAIFLGLCVLIKIFAVVLLKRLVKLSKKTKTTLDDFLVGLIQKIVPLAYLGALYVALNSLQLNATLKRAIDIIGMAILTILTVRVSMAVISYGFNIYWKSRGKDILLERSMTGILRVMKIIVWALAIIFFLDNLGFKISTVIAGLGIGGVAVALAAQAVLGDLFSYFAILFDRPFEIGDFIIIGDFLGSVEHIGIKTTRIRSLGGEQLIFSNTDLTNSRVRNYKRMEKRRVVFQLGVTYETKVKDLEAIPGLIENAIKNVSDTAFDRAHFFSYGDFSLMFEVVYYVLSADYNKYMDVQQEINLALKREFEQRGIEFAYPTQMLYVNKTEGK